MQNQRHQQKSLRMDFFQRRSSALPGASRKENFGTDSCYSGAARCSTLRRCCSLGKVESAGAAPNWPLLPARVTPRLRAHLLPVQLPGPCTLVSVHPRYWPQAAGRPGRSQPQSRDLAVNHQPTEASVVTCDDITSKIKQLGRVVTTTTATVCYDPRPIDSAERRMLTCAPSCRCCPNELRGSRRSAVLLRQPAELPLSSNDPSSRPPSTTAAFLRRSTPSTRSFPKRRIPTWSVVVL